MDVFRCLVVVILCFSFAQGYQIWKIQSYELCTSPGFKPLKEMRDIIRVISNEANIILREGKDSAVIIEQVWNLTAIRKAKSSCTFEVQPFKRKTNSILNTSKTGLYTVIRKMRFRKDSAGDCIDYVQFSKGNRSPSDKLCGELGVGTAEPGKLVFDERGDKLRITIHIDTKLPLNYPLELSLIVTSHGQCGFNPMSIDEFMCNPNDSFSCISSQFVNDDYINCMDPCLDEGGSCFPDKVTSNEVVFDKSSIAISALTSLVFTMLGVAACFWLCWKYHDCHRNENNTTRRHSQDIPTIELPSIPATGVPSTPSSAPQIEPTVKDLPPSYDELFPER